MQHHNHWLKLNQMTGPCPKTVRRDIGSRSARSMTPPRLHRDNVGTPPWELWTAGRARDQCYYRAVTSGTQTFSAVFIAEHKTDDRGTSFTHLRSPFPYPPSSNTSLSFHSITWGTHEVLTPVIPIGTVVLVVVACLGILSSLILGKHFSMVERVWIWEWERPRFQF